MSKPLSSKMAWELANPLWSQALNPVIANPLLSGTQLTGIALVSGTNIINHKLSRIQTGWFLTDLNVAATVYRSASFNSQTLTLTSSAACTVNIWVF